MTDVLSRSEPARLEAGGHVCWIVNEMAESVDQAATVLLEAAAYSQKPILFGPAGSESLTELAPRADIAMDPRTEVFGSGDLDPTRMFTYFREQTAAARAEGYRGLRVMADMRWTVSADLDSDHLIGFELLLGSLVKELDASIVCAYPKSSFDSDMTSAMLSVHEIEAGGEEPPQFKMFAHHDGSWRLSGEIDLAVASTFETAMTRIIEAGRCTIDVSALHFVDVAGIRQIAQAAQHSSQPIRLVGARPMLRRMWDLAGFTSTSPTVKLVD